MKRIAATIFLAPLCLALWGQGVPGWLNDSFRRTKYPESTYFTGFAYGGIPPGKTLQDVTKQLKTEAQAELSQKIRLQITSKAQSNISSTRVNGQYSEAEEFLKQTTATADVEVVGVKVESYYNPKAKTVHAFAYANRRELTGYYKGSLSMNLTQVESLLQTARSLEASGEKAKARQQCEAAKPLLGKARYAQSLLAAVNVNATAADLQQPKTEALYGQLAQTLARLAQGVLVYVESEERNFATLTTVVENRVKAVLAQRGCSFVNSPTQADWQLYIAAATRHHGDTYGFTTCYASVQVNLVDSRKGRSIFKDEFSQKGVATTREAAGRKALEDAAPVIMEKISPWIEH